MKKQQILFVLFFFFFLQFDVFAQEWAGSYKSGEYGNLEITKNSENNSFDFNFGYYSENRIREYNGHAVIQEGKTAIYSPNSSCKITFQFLADNQIKIEVSQACEEDQLYMIGTYDKMVDENTENKVEKTSLAKWNGQYKNLRNGLEVLISVNKNGNIDFIFYSESSCSKDFDKGTAVYWDQMNMAMFEDANTDCMIRFAYIDNQLHIKGESCDHGLFCIGFNGIYEIQHTE